MSLGLPEILVILVVALLVLGPSKLPDAARQMGKAMAEFRRVTSGFQNEVRDAFDGPFSTAPPPPPTEAQVPAPADAALAPPAAVPPPPVEAPAVEAAPPAPGPADDESFITQLLSTPEPATPGHTPEPEPHPPPDPTAH